MAVSSFREIVSAYWPIAATVVGLGMTGLFSYTDLNAAVGKNADDIARNERAIQARAAGFLFEDFKADAEEELIELAENVDKNEDAIRELLRRDDATVAKLELELTRLRADMDGANAELRRVLESQERQLETIIELLRAE